MDEARKKISVLWKYDYNASVIVTSDTCSKDPSKDTSGEYVVQQIKFYLKFKTVNKYIVEDDKEAIKKCITSILNDKSNVLIITVGGTGLCPRDVTPEATSEFYERRCYGIETSLYIVGLRSSPHAALSRLTAGVVKNCLIINFPGKLEACKQCFPRIEAIVEHAIEQINFDFDAIKKTHDRQIRDTKLSGDSHDSTFCSLEKVVNNNVFENSGYESKNLLVDKKPKDCETHEVYSVDSIVKSIAASGLHEHREVKPESNDNSTFVDDKCSHVKTMNVKSPYPMVDYEEALKIIESLSIYLCKTEQEVKLSLGTDEIVGRYLAENVYSKSTIPQYPCSTVDGYVLNISITMANFTKVLGQINARIVPSLEEFLELQKKADTVNNFFCYQVNTGGKLPEKNFVVIPVEETSELNENKTSVLIHRPKLENNSKYIRKPGIDLNSNDCLKSGTKIGPIELSILISMGHKSVKLTKRPKIGVLTTGDELVSFEDYCNGNIDTKDKVIDSNGPLLLNLFKSKHYSAMNLGIVEDNPKKISFKLQTSFIVCDIIIITGGASMGSKDHVKDVVKQIGGNIHFGRVNIKPGKPAAFASIEFGEENKFIFCLPGNPVSAYITTLSLVIPFIEHGLKNRSGKMLPLTINNIGDLINVQLANIVTENNSNSQDYFFDGRLEFVRAKLLVNDDGSLIIPYKATVTTRQQSSCLMNLLNCDCLIIIDPSLKDCKFIVGKSYRALKLKN